MNKTTKKTRIISLLSAAVMALGCFCTPAAAENGEVSTNNTTPITITKAVSGEDIPEGAEFTFTVLDAAGNPAAGTVTIGEESFDMADGRFTLAGGESAILSNLAGGGYTVTEDTPTQDNYSGTEITVNGEVISGLSAEFTVEELSESEGGWVADEYGYPVKVADTADDKATGGYYVYTVTDDMIGADGTVTVDFNKLAAIRLMTFAFWDPYGRMPVKIVNESSSQIYYYDYEFTTHNWIESGEAFIAKENPQMIDKYGMGWGEAWQSMMPILEEESMVSPILDEATGFDGEPIRLVIVPTRSVNSAVKAYFNSNEHPELRGDSGSAFSLLQMNAFGELIKGAFTINGANGASVSFGEDQSRTYADYICGYYGVDSLEQLSTEQKGKVLHSENQIGCYYDSVVVRSKDKTYSNFCIPRSALQDGTLNYFENYGFSEHTVEENGWLYTNRNSYYKFDKEYADKYAYQDDYYILENDPKIIEMAYDFLYENSISFTFDSKVDPLGTMWSSGFNGGIKIKDYYLKNETANDSVNRILGETVLESGDSLLLPNMVFSINPPDTYSEYRYFDFGFSVSFKSDATPEDGGRTIEFNNIYAAPTPEPEPEVTTEATTTSRRPVFTAVVVTTTTGETTTLEEETTPATTGETTATAEGTTAATTDVTTTATGSDSPITTAKTEAVENPETGASHAGIISFAVAAAIAATARIACGKSDRGKSNRGKRQEI